MAISITIQVNINLQQILLDIPILEKLDKYRVLGKIANLT